MKTPKAPKPTAEQLALEKMQADTLANLNNEENRRRKRLLLAAEGARAYNGSPLVRRAPSDKPGAAPPAATPHRAVTPQGAISSLADFIRHRGNG